MNATAVAAVAIGTAIVVGAAATLVFPRSLVILESAVGRLERYVYYAFRILVIAVALVYLYEWQVGELNS